MRLAPVATEEVVTNFETLLPGLIETGRCCDIVERLLPVDRQRAFQRSTVDSVGDLEAKSFASVITPDFLLSLNCELVCELAQAVERYHEALTEVAPATVAELVTEIDPVVTAHYLQHFRELLSHPPLSCSASFCVRLPMSLGFSTIIMRLGSTVGLSVSQPCLSATPL